MYMNLIDDLVYTYNCAIERTNKPTCPNRSPQRETGYWAEMVKTIGMLLPYILLTAENINRSIAFDRTNYFHFTMEITTNSSICRTSHISMTKRTN